MFDIFDEINTFLLWCCLPLRQTRHKIRRRARKLGDSCWWQHLSCAWLKYLLRRTRRRTVGVGSWIKRRKSRLFIFEELIFRTICAKTRFHNRINIKQNEEGITIKSGIGNMCFFAFWTGFHGCHAFEKVTDAAEKLRVKDTTSEILPKDARSYVRKQVVIWRPLFDCFGIILLPAMTFRSWNFLTISQELGERR